MRFAIKAAVLATALVLSNTQRTDAQVFEPPAPIVQSGPAFGGSSMSATAGPILPYSYYVALPSPARIYVPYGPTDSFPYYGSPYGRPALRPLVVVQPGRSAGEPHALLLSAGPLNSTLGTDRPPRR